MRVLITGASGFLGKAVVRAAIAEGHEVVALVRPAGNIDMLEWPSNVHIVRGDLRQIEQWATELDGVEAVVHLAAATGGDLPTQFSGTVVATENLLNRLPMKALRKLVHISSFSVYDYASIGFGRTLEESTPVEPRPENRDAYTTTKIVQERLVKEACEAAGTPLVIIRPGAIVGRGKDWGFGRVTSLGGFDLIFSPGARFPMTYVDNCAEAIVRALDAPVASGSIFNIVDDNLPTYGRYHRLGRRSGAKGVKRALYLPWFGVTLLGGAVSILNRVGFNGRAKLPEMLDLQRQRVRWRPLRYSNRAAKEHLGWSPRVPLAEAIARIAN